MVIGRYPTTNEFILNMIASLITLSKRHPNWINLFLVCAIGILSWSSAQAISLAFNAVYAAGQPLAYCQDSDNCLDAFSRKS